LTEQAQNAHYLRMNYVAPIFEKMGGPRKVAGALSYPESTVRSWLVRGSIPDSEKPAVFRLAQSIGADVRVCDFFPDQTLVRGRNEDAA
jgi:hypothetical protein